MRASALAGFLGVFVASSSFAAWPSDPLQNVPICTANGYQGPPFMLADGAGGTILIWADLRDSPAPQKPGIYAQRVDVNAFSVWEPNGSPILANGTDYVSFDAATTDGAGGAYVAWVNSTEGGTVRVQHVGADGLPSWSPTGVDVGQGQAIRMIPDGASGVIVVWRSWEGIGNSLGIRAQRLDAAGSTGWGPSGALLRTASAELPHDMHLVEDGEGGVLAAWMQNATGGTDWQVRCQGVAPSGDITMDPAGQVLASGANQYRVAAAADGAHGGVVAWAVLESASLSSVRAQRVGPDGQLLWPLSGVVLGTNTLYTPNDIMACASGSEDVIVAWKLVDLEGTRIQAQKVAPTGTPLWPEGGVTVSRPTHTDMISLAMHGDGTGGAFLAYVDVQIDVSDWSQELNVAAARVTADGDTPWGPYGVAISNAHGWQEAPAIAADGEGGAIIGWRDARYGETTPRGTDVYAQNVHADGTMGGGLASVQPGATALSARVWPQPSRSHVELAFTSPGGLAAVTIFDPQGRRIRELLRETVAVGETRLRWNGLDDSGATARAGLYFVAITTGGREIVRKIVLEH